MFKECLIITNVECSVVDGPSPLIVESYRNPNTWLTMKDWHDAEIDPYCEVKTEKIYPREFIDPITRHRMWIGMTKEVYDKLRMPYEAIDSLEEHVGSLHSRELILKTRIKEAKRYLATRWKKVDGARKRLNHYQGRFCTYHQLNDRVYKFENMSVWQFIRDKIGNMRLFRKETI